MMKALVLTWWEAKNNRRQYTYRASFLVASLIGMNWTCLGVRHFFFYFAITNKHARLSFSLKKSHGNASESRGNALRAFVYFEHVQPSTFGLRLALIYFWALNNWNDNSGGKIEARWWQPCRSLQSFCKLNAIFIHKIYIHKILKVNFALLFRHTVKFEEYFSNLKIVKKNWPKVIVLLKNLKAKSKIMKSSRDYLLLFLTFWKFQA